MTTPDGAAVRRQITVDASIERAFAAFVERFGDFKPPEHNLLGAEITEARFEPAVGGPASMTVPPMEVSAGGLVFWYTNLPVASSSVGTSAPSGSSRQTTPGPARSRCALSRRPRSEPGSSLNTAISIATDQAGNRSATPSTAMAGGRSTWRATRIWLARIARCRQSLSERKSLAQPKRCSPSCHRRESDLAGMAEGCRQRSYGQRRRSQVRARCHATRRIGRADRPDTSELVRFDPPRRWGPGSGWTHSGHRRCHAGMSRFGHPYVQVTIRLEFEGHGFGRFLVPLIVRRQAQREMPSIWRRSKNAWIARFESIGSLPSLALPLSSFAGDAARWSDCGTGDSTVQPPGRMVPQPRGFTLR